MGNTKIHIVISIIGAVLSISALICFSIVYSNVEAGIWALFACIHSILALILHFHYLRNTLHDKFSRKTLQYIGDFGMIGFVVGIALMIFYIFWEFYYKPGILPIKSSAVVKMVWSLMMAKWGILLYCTTRKYLRTYNDHQLFSDNPNMEET